MSDEPMIFSLSDDDAAVMEFTIASANMRPNDFTLNFAGKHYRVKHGDSIKTYSDGRFYVNGVLAEPINQSTEEHRHDG